MQYIWSGTKVIIRFINPTKFGIEFDKDRSLAAIFLSSICIHISVLHFENDYLYMYCVIHILFKMIYFGKPLQTVISNNCKRITRDAQHSYVLRYNKYYILTGCTYQEQCISMVNILASNHHLVAGTHRQLPILDFFGWPILSPIPNGFGDIFLALSNISAWLL